MNESIQLTTEILIELGVPICNKGYRYILDAVKYSASHYSPQIMITKDIYPYIARRYRTTSPRVERAIRHAIYTSWGKGEADFQHQLFGRSNPARRPTNKEFIATLTEQVRISSAPSYSSDISVDSLMY